MAENDDRPFDLRFDVRKDQRRADGRVNPAWVAAAQPFQVVRGDLGPVGRTLVAVELVEGGEYHGRDFLGRPIVLIPCGGRIVAGEFA